MSETRIEIVSLERTVCWCGTPFMIPAALLASAHNTGHTIYCPHGHTMTWKETQADKLRKERDRLKQQTAMLEDEKREAQARADKAEAANKRLKKRTAAGSCPCCRRTFSNMAEHMKHQHPQFVADSGAIIVPIERKPRKRAVGGA